MPSWDKISVAARNSPLSIAQVKEVLAEIRIFFPNVIFLPNFIESTGDKDLQTSLRNLDKTDFFTKEIDELVLKGVCRIAIHSAKDLPEPLTQGLTLAALTKGLDPTDSLVLREGETMHSLPSGAIIATSSIRREECVKMLKEDVQFQDIRGKIGDRLKKLATREVDGVVLAEAALIRLGLTHLNRLRLPGDTAPLQGKLAVVVKKVDHEMIELFSYINI